MLISILGPSHVLCIIIFGKLKLINVVWLKFIETIQVYLFEHHDN